MKRKRIRTPMVIDFSRVRSPLGIGKVYLYYSVKVARILLAYFLKTHPTLSYCQRLKQIKPVRTVFREFWVAWRKWHEFPFQYFINYLWLNSARQFSKIEDFVPLVRHEIERDRSVTFRSKEILSSKVFMSKLMSAYSIPGAQTVFYAESGRLFNARNVVLFDEEDFARILSRTTSDRLFLKLDISYGGQGVMCFKREGACYRDSDIGVLDFATLRAIAEQRDFVCQEGLRQIPELDMLNSDSVNTLRVMTRFRGDRVDVVAALLRIGRQGSFVDNGSAGGLSCHVDLESWRTSGTAVLWKAHPLEFLDHHPDTGVSFSGIKLPFREETFDLVSNFAKMFPGCEIIGWDISLTTGGPKIVEVNWNPDPDLAQMSAKSGCADWYLG